MKTTIYALTSLAALLFAVDAAAVSTPHPSNCAKDADCEDGNDCTRNFCNLEQVMTGNPDGSYYYRHLCRHSTSYESYYQCNVTTCDASTGVATTSSITKPAPNECQLEGVCVPEKADWPYDDDDMFTFAKKPDGTPCTEAHKGCAIGATCQGGACVAQKVTIGIQYESRKLTSPPPPLVVDAAAFFQSLPPGTPFYGVAAPTSLALWSNLTLLNIGKGITKDIAYHLKFGVGVQAMRVGKWGFRVGADLGYGGVILVDGVPLHSKWTAPPGLYWNKVFTNPSQTLSGFVHLDKGIHIVEVYGFDDIGNGPMKVEFNAPGRSSLWTPVAAEAVNVCACAGPNCVPCSSGLFHVDDSEAQVQASPKLNFAPASKFSVGFWAAFSPGAAQSNRVIGTKNGPSQKGWSIHYDDNKLCVSKGKGQPELLCAPVQSGNWHHYAVTYDAGKIRIYEDGVQKAKGAGSIATNSKRSLVIGHNETTDPSQTDDWLLDELAVWHHALTPAEVTSLYNRTKQPDDLSDAVAVWGFAEGDGETVGDGTGNGHTMALRGVEWESLCSL